MADISRNRILEAIVADLRNDDDILAIWLEGSDGTNSLDEYSDIDLVCYTREGRVDNAVSRLQSTLNSLGHVDISNEEQGRPGNNRYKVYHLQETPENLLIDVTFQSESFPVSFLHEDKAVVPVVLVDKANIVRYEHVNDESYRKQLRNQLMQSREVFRQRSRAVKYTKRGLFLESLIYYQKYVLHPLVEVLRIVHTPFQADCFLVHASRDFPAEVVSVLEILYGVKTVEEIADNIDLANQLFDEAVAEAENMV